MVKFLVVRFSSIGDIILTTPVVRHLKQQVEDSEIHYLTKSSFTSLLEANPYVDQIHSFNGELRSSIRELKKQESITSSIYIIIHVQLVSNMD